MPDTDLASSVPMVQLHAHLLWEPAALNVLPDSVHTAMLNSQCSIFMRTYSTFSSNAHPLGLIFISLPPPTIAQNNIFCIEGTKLSLTSCSNSSCMRVLSPLYPDIGVSVASHSLKISCLLGTNQVTHSLLGSIHNQTQRTNTLLLS